MQIIGKPNNSLNLPSRHARARLSRQSAVWKCISQISSNLVSWANRARIDTAPQVSSNPLCCKHRSRSWCELSTKKKVGIWLRRDLSLGKVVHNRNIQFSLCRFVSSWVVQCPGVKRTRRLRKGSKVRVPKAKASRFSFATAT